MNPWENNENEEQDVVETDGDISEMPQAIDT